MANIDRIKNRDAIEYLHLQGMTPKDIAEDMRSTFKDSAPSYTAAKNWVSNFKRGRTSVEDAPRSGGSVTIGTDETVSAVHDTIMQDRRTTLQHFQTIFGISYGRVHNIVVDILGIREVSSRWIPKDLNADQRRERVQCCEDIVRHIETDEDGFLLRYAAVDEMWVHDFEPETKREWQQWKHPSSPTPKTFRLQKSAGKVMASVFWYAEVVIMVDYLRRGVTVNAIAPTCAV